MISRRTLIAAATAAALFPAYSALAQTREFVLDKDYLLVKPALDLPKDHVILHDFFAYTCPHCLEFAPIFEEFKAELKDSGIEIIPVPVAWNESYEIFPKIYYSFEAMGLTDKYHMKFWNWVLHTDHSWNSKEDVLPDIERWIERQGIDLALWRRTFNSFTVRTKVRNANALWQRYGIDSTPMTGVSGRYLTAPHLVGNRRATIESIRFLIEKVRKER